MKLYHLSIGSLVKRFLLIMAIILASGFLALYAGSAFWFLAVFAFPIFLSCLLGLEFDRPHFLDKSAFWHHHTAHDKHGRLAH